MLKVLHLEDTVEDSELMTRTLRRGGLAPEVRRVDTEAEFRAALVEFRPDIVISDFSMPGYDGLSALSAVRMHDPLLPFIFMSGTIGEERATEALHRGATDYVLKAGWDRLPAAVSRALREAVEKRERTARDAKSRRLARIHAFASALSSASVRMGRRTRLFREACGAAIERGGFQSAWIGRPLIRRQGVRAFASAGLSLNLASTCARDRSVAQISCAAIARAYAERQYTVINDVEAGERSLIALPLLQSRKVVAIFLLIASEGRYFGEDEARLLAEMADTISHALERREQERSLNYLAYHDTLTGLPNRRLLEVRGADTLMSAKESSCCAVFLYLDLDRFKSINDTFGHVIGDEVLKTTARRLLCCTRPTDTVARVGGDEFVVVIASDKSDSATASLASRIAEVVAQPVDIGGRTVAVQCSVGVAMYPEGGADVAALLQSADAAMYREKMLRRAKRSLPEARRSD